MTEDELRQLNGVYERNSLELFALVREFGDMTQGKTGDELLHWKRREYKAIIELLEKHRRELDWRAGEKLEPMVHFAEASLAGRAGVNA